MIDNVKNTFAQFKQSDSNANGTQTSSFIPESKPDLYSFNLLG